MRRTVQHTCHKSAESYDKLALKFGVEKPPPDEGGFLIGAFVYYCVQVVLERPAVGAVTVLEHFTIVATVPLLT